MKYRAAIVAALCTVSLSACTVKRYPGDCYAAPTTTVRIKNRALIETPISPDFTSVPPQDDAASC